MTAMLDAPDEAEALELLHELGCTDGLPVVIPTAPRVDRMVLASGLDPNLSLGEMGPLGGNATVQSVAVCAVMAGCLPDYMPVVVAAVRAVTDPRFDATEVQGTTHCLAPLIIVNGPARLDCGPIASGFGCLGPGHRANASIGRALRLVMMNVGGARPGVSDMALHGHPGKFSFCVAEDEENSPFAPLHTSRGFAAGQSTVTVAGVEAPQSVIFTADADDPNNAQQLLRILGQSLARVGGNNAHFGGGTGVVLINPEHTAVLAAAGMSRQEVAEAIFGFAVNKVSDLQAVGGMKARPTGTDDVRRAFRSADDILVLAAGGAGLYSMVMTSWGAGPHGNPSITVEIETDQACEVPL